MYVDDSGAVYKAHVDDAYTDLLEYGGFELREDATERIRQRILDSSETYLTLVTSELAKAEILLNADEPDLAAAFFHAYLSLDGYLAAVIIEPISEVLMEPIATLFVENKLASHRRTIVRTLGRNLRDALLECICTDSRGKEESRTQIGEFDKISTLRNAIVHGFEEPTREQVEHCRGVARKTADLIEAERKQGREARADG